MRRFGMEINMGFWQRIFGKRKKKEEKKEDWDEIVYVRDDVDFHSKEERGRYITGCLEQIAEASKEMNLLTGEYALVTSYLTDMEEIEALPEKEREETDKIARRLQALEKERETYHEKKDRMEDLEYYQMRKQEQEVEEGIRKIKEGESYGELIKKDLQRLDREHHAYEFRRAELDTIMTNFKGMAVIFLTALVICILMLLVLQFVFEMNTYLGYFLAVGAAAAAIIVLCIKFIDAEREKHRVEVTINKLIQLQNKVKIRYVNNTNLLDYLYMKYNTDSGAKLERRWAAYQQEKEERKQYAEAEAKTEYYQKQLINRLSNYRIKDPQRWIHQTSALLDKREMVEIRHELILRRQSLRKQMDYNDGVARTAREEIMEIARQYPAYAEEIMDMADKYSG